MCKFAVPFSGTIQTTIFIHTHTPFCCRLFSSHHLYIHFTSIHIKNSYDFQMKNFHQRKPEFLCLSVHFWNVKICWWYSVSSLAFSCSFSLLLSLHPERWLSSTQFILPFTKMANVSDTLTQSERERDRESEIALLNLQMLRTSCSFSSSRPCFLHIMRLSCLPFFQGKKRERKNEEKKCYFKSFCIMRAKQISSLDRPHGTIVCVCARLCPCCAVAQHSSSAI